MGCSGSGSWYPRTTNLAFALWPRGEVSSVFHVRTQREVMIRDGWILSFRIRLTVLVSSQHFNSLFLASLKSSCSLMIFDFSMGLFGSTSQIRFMHHRIFDAFHQLLFWHFKFKTACIKGCFNRIIPYSFAIPLKIYPIFTRFYNASIINGFSEV